MSMDFTCYLHPGWNPRIRPADPRRDWMDATPESFAYRCLPLAIANAHGWEITCPMSFEAEWNGGAGIDAVTIKLPPGVQQDIAPVSIFGHGMLTFHIFGLFRTPPGWNLWAGGSPNKIKDGIAPLTGIIETDWSPFSFTMNWRFTRPHHPVRFEQDEAICFVFPVQRGVLEQMEPNSRRWTATPNYSSSSPPGAVRAMRFGPKSNATRRRRHPNTGRSATSTDVT